MQDATWTLGILRPEEPDVKFMRIQPETSTLQHTRREEEQVVLANHFPNNVCEQYPSPAENQ